MNNNSDLLEGEGTTNLSVFGSWQVLHEVCCLSDCGANTENSGGLGRLLGSDYACGLCSRELEAPPGWQREPRVSCTIFCYSQPVNHQCCGQTAPCGSDALRKLCQKEKNRGFLLRRPKTYTAHLPTMVWVCCTQEGPKTEKNRGFFFRRPKTYTAHSPYHGVT